MANTDSNLPPRNTDLCVILNTFFALSVLSIWFYCATVLCFHTFLFLLLYSNELISNVGEVYILQLKMHTLLILVILETVFYHQDSIFLYQNFISGSVERSLKLNL